MSPALSERAHMPRDIRDLFDQLAFAEDDVQSKRCALDEAEEWLESVKQKLREKGHDVP